MIRKQGIRAVYSVVRVEMLSSRGYSFEKKKKKRLNGFVGKNITMLLRVARKIMLFQQVFRLQINHFDMKYAH